MDDSPLSGRESLQGHGAAGGADFLCGAPGEGMQSLFPSLQIAACVQQYALSYRLAPIHHQGHQVLQCAQSFSAAADYQARILSGIDLQFRALRIFTAHIHPRLYVQERQHLASQLRRLRTHRWPPGDLYPRLGLAEDAQNAPAGFGQHLHIYFISLRAKFL